MRDLNDVEELKETEESETTDDAVVEESEVTDEAETVEEVESNDEAETVEEAESNDEVQAVEETETKDESEKILKSKNSKSEDPNMKKKLTFILAGVLGLILILTFFFVGATPVVKYGLYDKEADLNMRIAAKSKDKVAYVEGMKGLFFGKFYIPSGGKAKVTIKDTYKGCPVVGISNEAFKDSKAKNVKLPDSIEYIGKEAFANSSLVEINMPKSLKKIGEKAFYNCKNMKDVTLPDSVEEVKKEAFNTNNENFNLFTNHTISELYEIFEEGILTEAGKIKYVEKYEVLINGIIPNDPSVTRVKVLFGQEPDLTDIITALKSVKGYRFIGFKYNDTLVVDRNGSAVDGFKFADKVGQDNPTVTIDTVYYKEYTLAYDLAGGTIGSTNLKNPYTEEDQLVLPTETPAKEGYTFSGWYLDNTKVENGKWNYTEDITLVAKWTVNNYTLTYDVNGGDALSSNTLTVTYDASYTLAVPTRTGYTFAGWYNGDAKVENGTWKTASDMTLKANWTANTYTITYNVNGGDALSSNTLSVTYDAAYTLATPTRAGYTFTGWYNGETKVENGTWTSVNNITLKASWKVNDYTITYDVNGGNVLSNNKQTVTYDAAYTLVVPSRLGYGFDGWYNGTTKVENGTWKIASDVTLVAHWLANAYTITYNVNGGDALSSNTQAVLYDAAFTLITPTKTGYTFTGWYKDTVKVESGTWNNTADVTLTAHWQANDYTITYNVNGGKALDSNTQTVTFDEFFSLVTPLRTGYTFLGWYNAQTKVENGIWNTASDLTLTAQWEANDYAITYLVNGGDPLDDTQIVTFDAEYTLVVPTRTGYTFTGWFNGDVEVYSGVWKTDNDITLTAHWEAKSYTITYNVNGGDDLANNTQVVTFDAEYTLVTPTRTGYTFAGWYNGDEKVEDGVWTIATGATLFAHWTANTYVVTFDVNGGDELTEKTQTVTYDQVFTLITPTRTGYGFIGWYDGETKIENGVWNLTNGLSVKAHWQANAYTITYDVNGGDVLADNTQIATYDATYTLVTPTRTGYTFQGWYNGAELFEDGTWNLTSDITIVAHWKANTYTITYEVDGGNALSEDTLIVTYDEEYTLALPTRTGYSFAGWYNGSELFENGTWDLTDDITLTAHWEAKGYKVAIENYGTATVSFDVNGGTGAIDSQVIDMDTTIVYPAIPTRSGYVFAGWYDNAECTGDVFDFTNDVDGDITLYAKWLTYSDRATAIVYGENTINIIGGNSSDGTQYFAFVPLVSGSITINVGKNAWIGCSTSTPSGSTYSSAYNTKTLTVTAGTVYYISLQSYKCYTTDTYVGETYLNIVGDMPEAGGMLTNTLYEDVVYDSAYTLSVPSKVGYTFEGWYDGIGGTGTQYTDNAGHSINNWTGLNTIQLYARWQAIPSTITFDVNGGDALLDNTMDVEYDQDVTLLVPTRAGYAFVGWYDEETLVESGIWHYVEDVELQAHWEIVVYTIEYVLGGGVVDEENPTTYTVEDDEIVLNNPHRDGYNFVSWNDGGTIPHGSTGNKTFTATWQAIASTITFDVNTGDALLENTMNVEYDEDVTLPTPTKTGYTFLGWFDGETLVESGTWTYVVNVTLQAHWQVNTYHITYDGIREYATVSFNLNGAEGSVASQNINEENPLVYPEIPERSGYIFAGWYDNAACTGSPFDFSQALLDDVELFAKWNEVSNYISIMYVGDNVQVDINGQTLRYYPFVPLVSGSVTFYTESSLDTYGFLYNASKSQLTSNDDSGSGNNFSITYNVTAGTLYYIGARAYSTASGKATLYLTGTAIPTAGGIWTNPIVFEPDVDYGAVFIAPVPEARVGYTFLGWYDGVGGTGNKYTDEFGNCTNFWNKPNDATLYPKWEAIPSTITLDVNGGDALLETTMDVEYDEDVTLPTPSWAGHSFTGWYDGETLVESGVWHYITDVELQAHWVEYNINFIGGDITGMDFENELNDETFQVVAIDTDGDEITIEYTLLSGTITIGDTISVRLDVTGKYSTSRSKTVENIKVYGPSTIDYDDTREYINVGELVDIPYAFSATGTDTFTDSITVVGSIKEDQYEPGDLVTIVLSVTNPVGRVNTVEIENIRLYGEPVISRSNEKADMRADQEATAELFGITAVDSFGDEIIPVVTSQAVVAGNNIRVTATATDVKGNVSVLEFNVKVYGAPSFDNLTIPGVKVDDEITLELLGVVARDSFNVAISSENVEITAITGTQESGNELSVTVSAVDHLGNTNTRTYTGIRVYGDPTITFDDTIELMSYDDVANAEFFNAIGTSTFGEDLSVNVTLASGDFAGGEIVRFNLTATDAVGNETTVTTGDIKVYDALQIEIHFDTISPNSIKITSNGEEFNAYATDSFGDPCTITLESVSGDPLVAGTTVDVKLVATDVAGNSIDSDYIYETNIYDVPTVVYDYDSYYVYSTDNPLEMIKLVDSFGEDIEFTANIVAALSSEYVTVVHISGTDCVGNTYDGNISLDVVADPNEIVIHVFINGSEIITTRESGITEYDLPRYTGYTTTWVVNDVEMGNDASDVITVALDGNASSIRAYGTKVANRYNVTLNDVVNDVTVSFDLNGARGSIASQTINRTTGLVYPTVPTRSGYLFAGWYDNAEGTGTAFDFSQNVDEDTVLYAKWSTYSDRATQIAYGENTINITGGNTTQFFAFVPLVTGNITINVGKNAWIGCGSSTPTGSPYSSAYNTKTVSVTAGTVYYISLQSNSTSTAAAYTGETYLNIVGPMPTAGGLNDTYVVLNIAYDSSFTADLPAARVGYTFAGWYDGIGGTGTQYTDNAGHSLANWTTTSDITLYAKWEAIPSTITLDVNTGDALLEDTIDTSYDEDVVLPTPTKTGYTFVGWYDGETLVESGVWNIVGDVTLQAHWEATTYNVLLDGQKAVVSFDVNGGTGAIDSQIIDDTVGLTYPEKPTRSGYVFAGWYDNDACEGDIFDFTQDVTADITLYAKWIEAEDYISDIYVGDSIAVALTGRTIKYFAFVPLTSGSVTIYSSSSFDTYGYLYNASKAELKHDDDSAGSGQFKIIYDVTAGTLYYIGIRAYYEDTNGNATLNVTGTAPADGGINPSGLKNADVTYDSSFTLMIPTRTGYTFAGWYDGVGGTGTQYTDELGHSVINWNKANNATLYAKWEAIPSTITLDVNNGDALLEDTMDVEYDEDVTLPTPTRTGYTFLGWFDDETLVESGIWNIVGDVTLQAHWQANEYDVTLDGVKAPAVVSFDLNGAEGTIDNQEILDAVVLAYPTTPTRSGYVFAGWYDNAECTGDAFDFTSDIDDDITLYAKWIEISNLATGIILGENTINITGGGATQYFAFMPLVSETITINVGKEAYIGCGDTNPNGNYSGAKYGSVNKAVTAGTVYYISLQSRNNSSSSTYIGEAFLNIVCTLPTAGGSNTIGCVWIEKVAYDSAYTLEIPTRTGYTFLGWYDGIGGTGTQITDNTGHSLANWNLLSNVTLYAKWQAIPSTITFDVNNGNALVEDTMDVVYDEDVVLPTASRTGYTFAGWYDGETLVESGIWNVVGDVSLQAHWTPNTYTITLDGYDHISVSFDLNGGTGSVATQEITGETGLVYPASPTKDGYVFAGWYDNEECTGDLFDFSQDISESLILHAKWLTYSNLAEPIALGENTINITGGNLTQYFAFVPTVSGSITINVGKNAWIGCNKTTPNGSDYGGSAYNTITLTVTAGTVYYVSLQSKNCSTEDEYVGETTLTITTPEAGGKVSANSEQVEVAYDQAFTIKIINLYGYHFVGWFDGVGGTGTQYTDSEGHSLVNWTGLANITLYGKLEVANTTVTFDVNTGDALLENVLNYTYNTYVTLPTPTKAGYTFVGWYDGETEYVSGMWNELTNITLVAHWEVIDYIINYELSGGTKDEADPDTYNIESDEIVLHEPHRDGYTFVSWNDGGTIPHGSTGNKTFTATWLAIPSTITFDVNTGDALLETTMDVEYDEDVVLPTPTKTGYTFLGWYDGETLVASGPWHYTDDVELQAHWELTEYTITYVLTGGTKNEADPDTYTMDSEEIVLHDPTRTGYIFLSWNDGGVIPHGSTGNKTFSATWQAIASTITLDVNSGDALLETTIDTLYDENVDLPTPTKTGYTFLGWFDGETLVSSGPWHYTEDVELQAHWELTEYTITYVLSGGTKNEADPDNYTMHSEEIVLHDPSRTGYTFVSWDNEGTIPQGSTGNKTFTATWQAIASTITLDVNGGDALLETTIDTVYDADVTLPSPTRTGYRFTGWYDGETLVASGAWHIVGDVELQAHWAANTYIVSLYGIADDYTVSFNLNGAEGSIPSQVLTAENLSLEYPAIPTRSGYVFAGWFDNAECTGDPFDFTQVIDSNVILYAKWIQGTDFIGAINVGGTTEVNINGVTLNVYAFVPLVSGQVVIYSEGSVDTVGFLYDADRNELAYNDDGGNNRNFRIAYTVTAGNLYYIGTRAYSSGTGTSTLYLRGTTTPTAGGGINIDNVKRFYITYDSEFTLTVPTAPDGYVFAGWYSELGGTGTQFTDGEGNSLVNWNVANNAWVYAKFVTE